MRKYIGNQHGLEEHVEQEDVGGPRMTAIIIVSSTQHQAPCRSSVTRLRGVAGGRPPRCVSRLIRVPCQEASSTTGISTAGHADQHQRDPVHAGARKCTAELRDPRVLLGELVRRSRGVELGGP